MHDDKGVQIWLVGALDTDTKEVRFDIIKERNAANLKILVFNHIEAGSHIVQDGWPDYNFLDGNDSVYTHETHNL